MQILKKIIYSFAASAAVVAMLICLISGVSPLVILFRGALVFLGVLFIFFIGANLMRWAVILLTPKPESSQKKS